MSSRCHVQSSRKHWNECQLNMGMGTARNVNTCGNGNIRECGIHENGNSRECGIHMETADE